MRKDPPLGPHDFSRQVAPEASRDLRRTLEKFPELGANLALRLLKNSDDQRGCTAWRRLTISLSLTREDV